MAKEKVKFNCKENASGVIAVVRVLPYDDRPNDPNYDPPMINRVQDSCNPDDPGYFGDSSKSSLSNANQNPLGGLIFALIILYSSYF